MPYYRCVGDVPPKRHIQFRRPDGGLYAEELMGRAGFAGESSLLYHAHPPTTVVSTTAIDDVRPQLSPPGTHRPRHFRTHATEPAGDMVRGRRVVVANADVEICIAAPIETSPLYRNALGDELVFVQAGALGFDSSFGTLEVTDGDYVVVPRGTTHRWVVESAGVRALIVEARGQIRAPERYLTPTGQFREGAPYCERDLHAPTVPLVVDNSAAEVFVRHPGGLTQYTFAEHPFDVVGWDGCLYPYRFNIVDFEPITGRIHLPPPIHQTFEGPNFVVCSFVPRRLDDHPEAVPAPYNHSNVDSEEVLFYAGGEFISRKGAGIDVGSLTLHPAGFTHGPQPGSVEASLGAQWTNETAVMIDTFRPLAVATGLSDIADDEYQRSWTR